MIPGQFFLDKGSVRPIWRFLISVFFVLCANLAVGIILGLISVAVGWELRPLMLWASTLLFLALLGIFKFLTILDDKPLASVGFAFHKRWKAELVTGLVFGAAIMLAVAALEWASGLAHFTLSTISGGQMLIGSAYSCILFAIAAAGEEITFRGYPFQRLIEAAGPAWAILISSLIFGLVHWTNPSHTWLSTLNTALIGIPLAVAYLRTRALWLPLGIHFAWNFILGFVLGLPVSGIQFSRTLLSAEVSGARQFTGGNYGPEGSWLATGVIAIFTAYILVTRSISITPEMGALTSNNKGQPARTAGQSLGLSDPSSGETKMMFPGVK